MARIVAVHSYRGGTGKSNISANLATLLAWQGRRVGVVDTDVQSPGIHVLFGYDESKTERTLDDYLWGQCAIEDAAYDVLASLQTPEAPPPADGGALYLVPASIRPTDIARILREGYDIDLLGDGLEHLTEVLALDYLFIDSHP